MLRYFKWAGETPGAMFPSLGVAVWKDHPQAVWDADQQDALLQITGVYECDQDGNPLPAPPEAQEPPAEVPASPAPPEASQEPQDAPQDAAPE